MHTFIALPVSVGFLHITAFTGEKNWLDEDDDDDDDDG